VQGLSELGHRVNVRRAYTQEMGRGQAVMHNAATRTNFAASDPRADGAAVPEPILK
jgi:gamma-glutamyltranspeptidase/glutathione hydrolase